MKHVHANRRTQVQTHGIRTSTELNPLARLQPLDFISRFEPNSPTAAASVPPPQPKIAGAAAA